MLEHFSHEDAQILLKRIHTALKEGGSLVLCVPINDVWHLPAVRKVAQFVTIPTSEYKTFFGTQTVGAELQQIGFSIVELSPWFWFEDQLGIALPHSVYSLPLIGKYLAGSVNIRAVKSSDAPSSFLRHDGESFNIVNTLVHR